MPTTTTVQTVAVIGAGLIGCSWAALFAAAGYNVRLYDTRPGTQQQMADFWENVKPTLIRLGLATSETQPLLQVCDTLADAVHDADFIQECIPERLAAKQALYAEIEPLLKASAIVATSSSGLKLSDLQAQWQAPGRIIIAHPFNPPHLIPLVELYGNERTAADVLPTATALYEHCGKEVITLKREVLAHVANRLQAALWREAIHLVLDGVASLKDVDTAVRAGPGLRWAVMGPHLLLNLGGGEAGLRAYCEQFRDSYHQWWDDLGQPRLTDQAIDQLVEALQEEIADRDYATLRDERDQKLVAILGAMRDVDNQRRQEQAR
ncbi:MAG TPA: 3-hydroxyacyl-CoA dehydrogenase NAD-binding domain-containing protein [Pseudomonas sp.]|uniref:3-hydroxyacyl-CoA dehydrogenase NAD-binding domain-containing protein n=1 Tax=Pseudomonas sp. TaxID=306 RepID=UPI002B465ABA|nr:3-hydroxyacyl-CoA dehydrogenase NAD-binding domain-containing protein [Pseudomonas sp.]HKS15495.1 3-hydroxyacyl-CoA dehydrogenase NAD-binding domain-containing protein [Pseudomonas sp.]